MREIDIFVHLHSRYFSSICVSLPLHPHAKCLFATIVLRTSHTLRLCRRKMPFHFHCCCAFCLLPVIWLLPWKMKGCGCWFTARDMTFVDVCSFHFCFQCHSLVFGLFIAERGDSTTQLQHTNTTTVRPMAHKMSPSKQRAGSVAIE